MKNETSGNSALAEPLTGCQTSESAIFQKRSGYMGGIGPKSEPPFRAGRPFLCTMAGNRQSSTTDGPPWLHIESLAAAIHGRDDTDLVDIARQLHGMPPGKRQAIQDGTSAIIGQLTRLNLVLEAVDQDSCLPSAIDDLMSGRRIAEMTADEYAELARQAKAKTKDVDRLRQQVHDGINKCRVAASRGKALLESMTGRGRKSAKRKHA